MAFYHDHPDVLVTQAAVLDSGAGRVLLAGSPFFPGGGGQLPDRGVLRWAGGEAEVTGFEQSDGGVWHLLATEAEVAGTVELRVDPAFRELMRELHTATHILNAAVFLDFDGALVTGAQMSGDGTARMDFDLPGTDSDRLRAVSPVLADVVRQDLPVITTCGGTHLASTGSSPPIRVLRIANKGRHNRRVYIGLEGRMT